MTLSKIAPSALLLFLLALGLASPRAALAAPDGLACLKVALADLEVRYRQDVAEGRVPLPELSFDRRSLDRVVGDLIDRRERTLIITVPELRPALAPLGVPIVTPREISLAAAAAMRATYDPEHVIAAGGSTALDMGRAVAVSARLDSVPTILSTACISVNKSIAREDGVARAVVTQTPTRTIIPLRALMELPKDQRQLWSQSGFGDVFGRVSASIDNAYRSGHLNHAQVMKNTPAEFRAGLAWAEKNFVGYDEPAMRRLATLSHAASIEIVRTGNSAGSVGDEHKFYYKVMERHPEFNGAVPTHGQLVAVGTLISARAYGERTGDLQVYRQLRAAFVKLGLPTTAAQLGAIHLPREVIEQGLRDVVGANGFLADYFKAGDFKILDRIF